MEKDCLFGPEVGRVISKPAGHLITRETFLIQRQMGLDLEQATLDGTNLLVLLLDYNKFFD